MFPVLLPDIKTDPVRPGKEPCCRQISKNSEKPVIRSQTRQTTCYHHNEDNSSNSHCKTGGKLFQSIQIKLSPFSQIVILTWDARQVAFGGLAGFLFVESFKFSLRPSVL